MSTYSVEGTTFDLYAKAQDYAAELSQNERRSVEVVKIITGKKIVIGAEWDKIASLPEYFRDV